MEGAGVALALPVLVTMWMPEADMAVALLAGIVDWPTMKGWQEVPAWQIVNDARQLLGGAWMWLLAAVAIREAHTVSWTRAAVATGVGLIPAAAISYLVIR